MRSIEDKRKWTVITLNVLILFLEIKAFVTEFSAGMFMYYTNLSNIIAAVACLATLAGLVFSYGDRAEAIASWLKYIAVCMMTVTLVVVICILAPMQGVQSLYSGNLYYFHLACPILLLISFVFFERIKLDRKKVYIGMAPTLIYAAIAIVCNCVGAWNGPYPFLKVREQPIYMSCIWGIVVLGGAWLIAYLLMRLRRYNQNADVPRL